MNFWNTFAALFSNFGALTWQMVVMWGIGALLIYLAIVKKMEPSLLLPMGFGAILVNLPASGAITQGDTVGPISALFEAGMSNELFPLLLFIGIGAMIDFGPLLEKPWLMLFGAAAQFGIFFTLFLAGFFFDMRRRVHYGHRRSGRPHRHFCGKTPESLLSEHAIMVAALQLRRHWYPSYVLGHPSPTTEGTPHPCAPAKAARHPSTTKSVPPLWSRWSPVW